MSRSENGAFGRRFSHRRPPARRRRMWFHSNAPRLSLPWSAPTWRKPILPKQSKSHLASFPVPRNACFRVANIRRQSLFRLSQLMIVWRFTGPPDRREARTVSPLTRANVVPSLSIRRVFRVHRSADGRFETRNGETRRNALGFDGTRSMAIATASRKATLARREGFRAIVEAQQSDGALND